MQIEPTSKPMKLAKEQIARQFSRAAKSYDDAAALQVEMAKQLIRKISPDLSGRLVDLGCGTGTSLERIAALDQFNLTGIDIAPGMIELAQQRLPEAEFLCGDLEQTPLSDNSVDIVFSNAAIQWCDTQAAFREMDRIVRPGGAILVSTFGPQTLKEWRMGWGSDPDSSNHIHDFESVESLRQIVGELRIEPFEISSAIRKFEYRSVDAMFQSIKRLGATNASVDRNPGLMGRTRYQEIRAGFESQLKRDGQLTTTFECIYLTAEGTTESHATNSIDAPRDWAT